MLVLGGGGGAGDDEEETSDQQKSNFGAIITVPLISWANWTPLNEHKVINPWLIVYRVAFLCN